jgi:hypothetical protein
MHGTIADQCFHADRQPFGQHPDHALDFILSVVDRQLSLEINVIAPLANFWRADRESTRRVDN